MVAQECSALIERSTVFKGSCCGNGIFERGLGFARSAWVACAGGGQQCENGRKKMGVVKLDCFFFVVVVVVVVVLDLVATAAWQELFTSTELQLCCGLSARPCALLVVADQRHDAAGEAGEGPPADRVRYSGPHAEALGGRSRPGENYCTC